MPRRVGGIRGSSSARWDRKLSPAQRRKLNRKSRRNSAPTKKAAAAKAKTRSGKQEHGGQKSRPTSKARSTTKAGKKATAKKKAEARSRYDRQETVALERGMRMLDGKRPFGPNPKNKPGKKNNRRGGLTNHQKETMRAMNQQLRRKKVRSKSRQQKQKSRAVNESTKWNFNLAERMAFEAGNHQRMTRLSAKPKIPKQRSWNNNYGRGMR